MKIYTPEQSIPICSVKFDKDGKAVLRFKKSGQSEVEEMDFDDFIAFMTGSVFKIMVGSPHARPSQIGNRKNK